MSVPRKGSRVVSVGEDQYHWYIRKKPTYSEGAFESPMRVAIESAEGEGCALLVDLGVSRPDNWIEPHQTSVTPRLVAEIIRNALSAGWKPNVPGSAFRLSYPLIKDRP